jgi:ABC-type amino acid transport substrate-binding protein
MGTTFESLDLLRHGMTCSTAAHPALSWRFLHLGTRLLLGGLLFALCTWTPAYSEGTSACNPPAGQPEEQLRIGIREAPPFVVDDDLRGLRGLSIDLWESVAAGIGLENGYVYVECPLSAKIPALEDGALDVVISPLTITSERTERFDFSVQYLSSGLVVARLQTEGIDFRYAGQILWNMLMQQRTVIAVLSFIALNILLAYAVSRRVKGTSDEDAPDRPMGRGAFFMYETMARTSGLKSLENAFPTATGRLLEAAMVVVGLTFSAGVFSVLTTSFINSVDRTETVAWDELPLHRVATLANSTGQSFMENRVEADALFRCDRTLPKDKETGCLIAPSWDAALQHLQAGDVDVVLGDWLQLTYLARSGAYPRVQIQPRSFVSEPYGWGITLEQDALRRKIDREILARLRHVQWRELVQEYLGEGSISPQ